MGRPPKLTKEEREEMKREREELKTPYQQLADKYKVSLSTVLYHCRPVFKEKRMQYNKRWQEENYSHFRKQQLDYQKKKFKRASREK